MVFLLSDEDLDRVGSTEPDQHENLERKTNKRLLRAALEVLTDEEREIVERYYFEGERMDEIAAAFGHSKSWVSRVNTRALEKMKTQILGSGDG